MGQEHLLPSRLLPRTLAPAWDTGPEDPPGPDPGETSDSAPPSWLGPLPGFLFPQQTERPPAPPDPLHGDLNVKSPHACPQLTPPPRHIPALSFPGCAPFPFSSQKGHQPSPSTPLPPALPSTAARPTSPLRPPHSQAPGPCVSLRSSTVTDKRWQGGERGEEAWSLLVHPCLPLRGEVSLVPSAATSLEDRTFGDLHSARTFPPETFGGAGSSQLLLPGDHQSLGNHSAPLPSLSLLPPSLGTPGIPPQTQSSVRRGPSPHTSATPRLLCLLGPSTPSPNKLPPPYQLGYSSGSSKS